MQLNLTPNENHELLVKLYATTQVTLLSDHASDYFQLFSYFSVVQEVKCKPSQESRRQQPNAQCVTHQHTMRLVVLSFF